MGLNCLPYYKLVFPSAVFQGILLLLIDKYYYLFLDLFEANIILKYRLFLNSFYYHFACDCMLRIFCRVLLQFFDMNLSDFKARIYLLSNGM